MCNLFHPMYYLFVKIGPVFCATGQLKSFGEELLKGKISWGDFDLSLSCRLTKRKFSGEKNFKILKGDINFDYFSKFHISLRSPLTALNHINIRSSKASWISYPQCRFSQKTFPASDNVFASHQPSCSSSIKDFRSKNTRKFSNKKM